MTHEQKTPEPEKAGHQLSPLSLFIRQEALKNHLRFIEMEKVKKQILEINNNAVK